MNKTAQERYDEIKMEIIKISESYIHIAQNVKDEPKTYETRYFALLHMRLVELIKELNKMSASFQIEIPLMYKTFVNKLRRVLFDYSDQKYKGDITFSKEGNDYLI